MGKRQPWDDLYNPKKKNTIEEIIPDIPKEVEIEIRDYQKDVTAIGKRIAYGVVCGSITGSIFGIVDVMRDSKAMAAKTSVGTAKVMRYSYYFGGFFGGYQGVRKTLSLYNPQSAEVNLMSAAAVSMFPLIIFPKLRPLFPYGVMLVALDALQGINDV